MLQIYVCAFECLNLISLMVLHTLHYSWSKMGCLSSMTFQLPNVLTNNCEQEEETQGNSVSKQLLPSLNPILEVSRSCFH